MGRVIIPILQIENLRLQVVKQPVECHRTRKGRTEI